jgi:tetratricopeptide (TPR) repeat protein
MEGTRFAMRRLAVIAGWGLLSWLIAAQAGCSGIGVRHDVNRAKLTAEEATQVRQISEDAQGAIDRHDYERARVELLQLATQAPESAEALQRLGAVLMLEKRFDDAEACFRSALKSDPEYVLALIGLGEAEAHRCDFGNALKRFETAIEIDPYRSHAHFCKGRLLEAMGQPDPALAEYFRALEFDPNNPETSLRIAAIQLGRNQPEQALARLDQAVELAAENTEARFFRGQAYLALGHIPQAIDDLRFAAGRISDQPQLFYQLALALEADHKPAEALRAAQKALDLAPADPGARGLTERLALAVTTPGITKRVSNPGASPADQNRIRQAPLAEPVR